MIKKVCAFVLSIVLFLSFSQALYAAPQSLDPTSSSESVEWTNPGNVKPIQLFPQAASKPLQLTRIPTKQPIPLIVDTFWSCETKIGLEICDLVLRVCNNDQTLCVDL